MDENPIQQPIQPTNTSKPTFRPYILLIALSTIAVYLISAKYFNFWPFEVLGPIPTFNLQPSPHSNAQNLKTYRNEEYGFEFKYSKDNTLYECGVGKSFVVHLNEPCDTGKLPPISIGVESEHTVDEVISSYKSFLKSGTGFTETKVNVSGVSSTKLSINEKLANFPKAYKEYVVFSKDKFNFVVAGDNSISIDQILSTIKFTDVADMSTWKIFVSQGGWSMEYPNDWKVSSCHACSDPTEKGLFVDFEPPVNLLEEGLVSVQPYPDKELVQTLEQLFTKLKEFPAEPHLVEERTTINGLPAFRIVYGQKGNIYGEMIYLVDGSKVVGIYLFSSYPNIHKELSDFKLLPTFNKMLSTFKFVK